MVGNPPVLLDGKSNDIYAHLHFSEGLLVLSLGFLSRYAEVISRSLEPVKSPFYIMLAQVFLYPPSSVPLGAPFALLFLPDTAFRPPGAVERIHKDLLRFMSLG